MNDTYDKHPDVAWQYRETDCILYEIDVSSPSRWLGYVKIADEWVEVVDRKNSLGRDKMMESVESKLDGLVREAKRDKQHPWIVQHDHAEPNVNWRWPRYDPLDIDADPIGVDPINDTIWDTSDITTISTGSGNDEDISSLTTE